MAHTYKDPSVDRFYAEICAGQLHGIAAAPARTNDVHELYQLWCNRNGIPGLASVGHFVAAMRRRQGVPFRRKRYVIGDLVFGPSGVLYLSVPPAPRPGFEAEWLGEHISKFRAGVSAYRAISHGVRVGA